MSISNYSTNQHHYDDIETETEADDDDDLGALREPALQTLNINKRKVGFHIRTSLIPSCHLF
jgi:hypothetical protein